MDRSALALVEDKLLEAPEDPHQSGSKAKKEVLGHLDNFGSLRDSDFLPPGTKFISLNNVFVTDIYWACFFLTASPETLALLQSYGWSCLPAKMSAEDTASPYAGAISEATTLAGEFDAED